MFMKKQIFLIVIIASVSFLSSCAKTGEIRIANEYTEQQDAFDDLIKSIESLNCDCGIVKTKGAGKDTIKASADIAGYVAGNNMGQTLVPGLERQQGLLVLLSDFWLEVNTEV